MPDRDQPTRLLVIRHGQSEWNALGRGHGWSDPPLSPLGLEQAQSAVDALARRLIVAHGGVVRPRRPAEVERHPVDFLSGHWFTWDGGRLHAGDIFHAVQPVGPDF